MSLHRQFVFTRFIASATCNHFHTLDSMHFSVIL